MALLRLREKGHGGSAVSLNGILLCLTSSLPLMASPHPYIVPLPPPNSNIATINSSNASINSSDRSLKRSQGVRRAGPTISIADKMLR
eukprot:184764-Rhodomonas_salina.2